jgi:DNA-binding response OmpR family regulator
VSEHGGEISVRNVPPRGACFTIQLPLSSVPDRLPRTNRELGEYQVQSRILLIDCEDAVLDIEREFLRPHYRGVHAIRNALEAVRLLETEQFDLIVAEWKANGVFAGQEFYDWIRRFHPELVNRVIFTLSGTSTMEGVPLDVQRSCSLLRKPFQSDELLGMIRDSLRATDVSELKR